MKLFLTSKVFGNDIASHKLKENIGLNIENARVLFIPTALGDKFSPDKYLVSAITVWASLDESFLK